MSISIDEFNLFEAVLTYAVDENHDASPQTFLYQHGFNEEIFFAHNYIARIEKEIEIEQAILTDNCHIYFVGLPGSGKTTITRRVLGRLQKEHGAMNIHIDFKKFPTVNKESKVQFELMHDYIISNIKAALDNEIIGRSINTKRILIYLGKKFNKVKTDEFANEEFALALKEVYDLYCFEMPQVIMESFDDWFESKLFKQKGSEFKVLYDKLCASLLPHNLIDFLVNSAELYKFCIISFDNLDSIGDKEVRKTFITVFRSSFNIYKGSTRLIATIRSKNFNLNAADHGTYIVNEIGLDYLEFVTAEDLSPDALQKTNAPFTFKSLDRRLQLKHHKKGKERFAKLIYEKRLEYFTGKVLKTVNTQKGEVEEYFSIIHNNDRLRVSFFDLCNHDRRRMLVEICSFLRYLIFDVRISISELSDSKDEIDFLLESLFYGWIKRKNKFYEDSIYNLPKDVNRWLSLSQQPIGCSIDHLIFACIFNATGLDLDDYVFDKQINLNEVVLLLSELGFQKQYILDRIWFLYRDKDTHEYKGLLEIANSIDNDPPTHKSDDYIISLTPRSYYLVLYSSLKYISVLADIQGEDFRNMIPFNAEEGDDSKPLTRVKLEKCLRFLSRMAEMHLQGLFMIRNKLYANHNENWFSFYRSKFCIKANTDDVYGDGIGSLLFENLHSSICKFLKNQRGSESDMAKRNLGRFQLIVDQFEDLGKYFLQEVTKLRKLTDEVVPIKNVSFEKKILFDVFFDK